MECSGEVPHHYLASRIPFGRISDLGLITFMIEHQKEMQRRKAEAANRQAMYSAGGTLLGAGIGAAVGTLVAPGAGTAAGASLGATMGGSLGTLASTQ